MRAAWPHAPDQAEVRRAARALWEWTRVVWEEAERLLMHPVTIEVDELRLLEAVDQIYTWK